ncbi:hypothetical protein AC1031_019410 [Aphanomyces cochlioides]|nr:hypothetical protein AC1031_019410 [Aphanomyces cochlioides]
MTITDVDNMFAMMGFGLRCGLNGAEYTAASRYQGTEWDAVGCSSQFLLNFRYHRGNFQEIGSFQSYDMALNHEFDPFSTSESIFEVFRRHSKEFSLRPTLADDKFICSLSHIFPGSYAAGFYCYVWSEMLAADAYACFAEAKSEQEWLALGRKYRDTMLALIGPAHPMEAFEKFRGRLPSTEGLLKQYGLD